MRAFFYGNWAYGFFAVALCVEAALQQRTALNGPLYHLITFLAVVVFYNHAYRTHTTTGGADDRARWYVRNGKVMRRVQFALVALLVGALALAGAACGQRLLAMDGTQLFLFAVFPAVGLAYYGVGQRGLRRVGWLKPFVLGFVWAGVVTVYPALVRAVLDGGSIPDPGASVRLFFKNMMFVAMLGVLFDIKDHAGDHRNDLRTFVVRRGLRTTLFRIVLPLTVLGLLTFLGYGAFNGFSIPKLLLNTVPFAALVAVIYALRKRRSMAYYLVVVDGLLLVKAVCGSVAMVWF
ncbi:MAG: hypothetical protein JNM62_10245 [Flavobacteriales bacterium]|nr:hypothetical protein [Flavobacteriales bacterium]